MGLLRQHRSRIFGLLPFAKPLTPFADETVRNIFGYDELLTRYVVDHIMDLMSRRRLCGARLTAMGGSRGLAALYAT